MTGSQSNARQRLGRRGEEIAARRLEAEGYRVLTRNYRCPYGEVDLVAKEGDCLVFVEVRTRRGDEWGTPEESVTKAKQLRLLKVAQNYLDEHGSWDVDWRVDVVAIDVDERGRVRRLDVVRDAVSL
jgi:putative endonuclease